MNLWIWVIVGVLLIWIAISGKLGSLLGAIIDPGSMMDSSGTVTDIGGGKA